MRAVIVQARMRSWRFPGKIVAPWGTDTMLATVLRRAKRIPADHYVVATDAESRAFVERPWADGWTIFAGEPDNVLKRYVDSVDWLQRDLGLAEPITEVVRVCGDSPFIDPVVFAMACEAHDVDRWDSTYPVPGVPGVTGGVVSMRALRTLLASEPTEEERTHVTLGINPGRGFRCQEIAIDLSVDTLEEYQRLVKYQEFSR